MKPTLAIVLAAIAEPASASELDDLITALRGPGNPPPNRATAPPPPPRLQPSALDATQPTTRAGEQVFESTSDRSDLEAEVLSLRAQLAQIEALSANDEPDVETPWSVELTYASAFVDAGENVFAEGSPWDSHAAMIPALSWTHRTTGLTVGYEGVFQTEGGNASALIAAGVGHKQAIYTGIERSPWSEQLAIGVALTTTFFPFADPKLTDIASPAALEGSVSVTWEGPATFSVGIAYENGLQRELWDEHKLTIEPSVSHESVISQQVSAAFGANVAVSYADDLAMNGGVDLGLSLSVLDGVGLSPSAHLAWSRDADACEAREATFLWWDVVVGTSF